MLNMGLKSCAAWHGHVPKLPKASMQSWHTYLAAGDASTDSCLAEPEDIGLAFRRIMPVPSGVHAAVKEKVCLCSSGLEELFCARSRLICLGGIFVVVCEFRAHFEPDAVREEG